MLKEIDLLTLEWDKMVLELSILLLDLMQEILLEEEIFFQMEKEVHFSL